MAETKTTETRTRKPAPKAAAKYSKRTVSAHPFDMLNVRSQPKANASVTGTVADGEQIDVADEAGGWCEVEGGGYVMAKYLV